MTLFERIAQAHKGIRPQVPVTPLYESPAFSKALGCEVLLKAEHLHETGSFKIRGAVNKVRVLDETARRKGVLSASSGNHGQAIARAGALAGVPTTMYVSSAAAPVKVAAIRSRGANVVVVEGNPVNSEYQARRDAQTKSLTYVSPYNDFDVVAGQGTVGIELFEQAPDLDAVFISVGGGGLVAGAGAALKHLSPRTKIVAVWAENSQCMLAALKAGRIVDTPESPTISDGTAGAVEEGSITFPICQEVIDETVTVTEAEIASAMRDLALHEHWIVEGATGVAMAGLIKTAEAYKGRKVAVVVCGRNIGLDIFLKAIS